MKLHLPIGLRRALVAVLAALPVSTVAVTMTSATASAATTAEIQAAVKAHNDKSGTTKIYNKTYGGDGYNCTDITTISVAEGSKVSSDIQDFISSANPGNNGYYTLTGSQFNVSTTGTKTISCNTGEHKILWWARDHTGAESATVTINSVDYYLGEELDLGNHGINVANPAPNSITLGATTAGVASKAGLTATTVDLTAISGITVKTASSVTATTGAVTLNGGSKVTVNGASSVQGTTGATLTATNGVSVAGNSNVSSTSGAVTLNGGTGVTVTGASTVSGTAVTMSGTNVAVEGASTSVTAATGDVQLKGSSTNKIQSGAVVTANQGNIKLGDGKTDWSLLEGTHLTSASVNTISNSTVTTANGGITLESATGKNAITSNSTVTAGKDVLLSSQSNNNEISGSAVTAGGNVTLRSTGNYNSILDAFNLIMPGDNVVTNSTVTATTGNVTLTGMGNTITGSTLNAKDGAVQLNALMGNTISGTNTVITGTTGITLGSTTTVGSIATLNTFMNNITNGQLITTGDGANIKLFGMMNTLGDDDVTGNLTLQSKNGSIELTGAPQDDTVVNNIGLVIGMMKNNASVKALLTQFGLMDADGNMSAEQEAALKVLLKQSGNIVQSGSKLIAADDVSLDAVVNMVRSGVLQASDKVTVDGGINAMLGATISGNTVDFKASEKNIINMGEMLQLLPVVKNLLVDEEGNIMGIPATALDTLKTNLGDSLNSVNISANLLNAGSVTATDKVTMTGTANVLIGGADLFGKDIEMKGVDTNLPLGKLITEALKIEALKNKLPLDLNTLPDGTLDILTSALDKVSDRFSVNMVHGGISNVGYGQTDTVKMTALGNLVTQNAYVQGNDVTLTGLANLVALGGTGENEGATVIGRNSVTLDGMANVVYEGKVLGGNITMGMSDTNLYKDALTTEELNGILTKVKDSGLLNSMLPLDKLPFDGATDMVFSVLGAVSDQFSLNAVYNGLVGDATTSSVKMTALGNLVAGASTVQGADVTMTGLANVLGLGATVTGNSSVTLDGMFNVLYNGKVTGNTITMGLSDANGYKGGLTVDELVSCLPDTVSGKDITSLKSTLSTLLTTYGPAYHNVNMLMGPDTVLTGTSVNLGGYTVMNMLSDRVKVNADSVSMSGITNILTDGTSIDAGSIELAGTANLVSHLTLGDVMNALKGEELPAADAASTTTLTATNNITMWGTANVLHGGALVKSESGNVHMGGTPLGVDSLTFNQCLAMANTVGMGDKLMGTAKDMLTQLLARAGVADSAAAAQQVIDTFLEDYGDTPLPPEVLSSSLNMVSDGAKVQALNGKVSMDGTANVLLNHAEVQGKDVELTGTANAVVGGAKLYGTNIKLQGKDMELHLGALAGVILDSGVVEKVLPGVEMPTSSEVMASLLKLNEVKGSVNLVYGDNSKVGHGQTASVTMQALGNAVLDNSAVQAKDVTMTGLGNLVGLGATVTGSNTLNLDGVANVVYNGKLSGNTITMGVTKDNPYKDTLPLDAMFNLLPDTVSGYDISAIKGALPGLLSSYGPAYYNMNLVMGPDAALEGSKVYLGGNTVMNMLSDRATVTADSVVLSGFSNIVTDGTTIDAGNLEMAGTLNFVSHMTLADIQNMLAGKEINRTITPTTLTADGGLNIWGTANVVHGSVVLNSTNGNVTMGSKGTPILGIDSLTLDQCEALVKELGLYDVLTDENNTTLSDLLARAGVATGEKAEQLLAQAKGLIKDLLTNYDGVELPKGLLTSNVNMVTGGAQVLANNGAVTMNGTANVLHGYKTVVNGNSVTLNGMGNVVMGGANVYGDNILLHGVDRNLNLGTIGSVLLSSGMLDSLVDKLPDGVTLPDDATLGKVLTALDKVNGSANVVWGGSTNVGDTNTQSVTMEALANIVARNAVVTADTVTMQGTGKGLKALESLTLQQCLGLAQKMGLVDTLKNAAGETLGELLTRAEAEGLDKETADKLVSEAKDMLKGFLTQYGDTTLPEEFLAGNMNLVLDGAQVTAGKDVNMSGALNTVAGGATVSAGADVNMSGGVNLVVDTTIQNVLDTITTGSLSSVTAGGNAVTTITAQDDINLNALVNVVNGGKVQLSATDEVNMTGAANMVGSKAQVSAKNINLNGKDAKLDTKLELDGIVPDRFADEAELVLNKALEEGASINLVMGGADLEAERDITMSGLASAVVDTTLGNVVDALKNQSIDPLLQGGTDETTLTAGRDINMHSKLNAVNGGKVVLSAGEDVHMEGALNVVHGNAQVSAGKQVNVRGVANLVAGGADLKGETVLLQGNDAMDDELDKVAGMLVPGLSLPSGVSGTVVMGDGTTVTATKGVTMHGNLNMVAEKAVVAGNSTYAEGTLNIVTGEAQVNAETTATMVGSMGNLVLDAATVTAKTGDISLKSSGFEHAGVDTLIDKLNNKLGGLLPDSMADLSVDLKDLMAQGGVNAVMSGAHVNAASGKVTMLAAVNAIDAAQVSAQKDVVMEGRAKHILNNATVVSNEGNITISGGIGTMTGTTTMTAEQGQVTIKDMTMNADATTTIVAGKGLLVQNAKNSSLGSVEIGGTSTIDAASDVVIESLITTGGDTLIENFGKLTVKDANVAGTTIDNVGIMNVTGTLTMQSTTLEFHTDSLTSNSTAINLTGGSLSSASMLTMLADSTDAISGVIFNLNLSESIFSKSLTQDVYLELFTGASAADHALVAGAFQDDELQFNITGFTPTNVNVQLQHVNNSVVLTGTISIPEPTTATLSLLALAGLAARRRRKN